MTLNNGTPSDSPDTIGFKQIVGVIRRHAIEGILIISLFITFAYIVAENLPQKFKSKAVLSIQSSYFQHPLVSDLLSEVHDPSELSAQRLSLLRFALNDQFLDRLGEKYNLYSPSPASQSQLVLERELFLKKIEYFSVSPTSFQISIISHQAQSAFLLTNEVLAQMTFTLIEQRYQTLMQAREAILKQATLLNRTLVTTDTPSMSPQQETLRAELATMEENLAALRTRFTEIHPDILRLKAKSEAIKTQIARLPAQTEMAEQEYVNVFLSPASRASTQEIFDDLLKKLSHLNIVLEMERDRQNVSYLAVIEQPVVPTKSFSPDRAQFMLIGAVCGLLLLAFRVIYSELQRASMLTPDQVSAAFNLELLGELPPFTQGEYILALEGKRHSDELALPGMER